MSSFASRQPARRPQYIRKMPEAGKYHTLTVSRVSDHGLYLADEEGGEVLLPNRYVSASMKPGDRMDVFVYHDSKDRPIATTRRPKATAGEFACLEVVDKTVHGAFMDWGIEGKDLFVPNRNQQVPMEAGRKYVVMLYRDNVSGRIVGTSKLGKYVSNEEITVKPGDRVDALVARRVKDGFRVIVENRHWGMLYDNQMFAPVHIGDRVQAWVRKITDDGRIDLALQQEGFDEVRSAAEKLTEIMRGAGGLLTLTDDSSPEEVRRTAAMSKKVFKRALGYMLSRGRIIMTDEGIELKNGGNEENTVG